MSTKKQAAKKAATKEATPEKPKAKAKSVKVEAVKRLVEGGEVYLPGEVFETSEKRAKALGPVVKTPSDD
jgi:osmotically-inducible protein OsmY